MKLKFGHGRLIFLVGLAVMATICFSIKTLADDTTTNDQLGEDAADIVRKRGYLAEDHFVITSDGYIINVIRCNNPLINGGLAGALTNKSILLMIHGILSNAQGFVMNSANARPSNYGHLSAGELSLEELERLLGTDPASNSLVFTALNWGHEVWLMNKRGTRYSQGHINEPAWTSPISAMGQFFDGDSPLWPSNWWRSSKLNEEIMKKGDGVNQDTNSPFLGPISSILSIRYNLTYLFQAVNPRYWRFCLDEQAKYDVPAVVDYVLKQTKRQKLSVVGHSAGGAVILMSLIEKPELAEKLEQALLWAPAMDLGNTLRNGNPVVATVIEHLLPFTTNYVGPIPPNILVSAIQGVAAAFCANDISQQYLCSTLTSLAAGLGKDQQKIRPGFMTSFMETTASHELTQLIQSIYKGRMYYFDYGSYINRDKYGSDEPPVYNSSRIKLTTMSLWEGAHDALVTPLDAEILLSDLQVPIDRHLIGGLTDDVYFNHISFLLHYNMSRLLILPSLKRLETGF